MRHYRVSMAILLLTCCILLQCSRSTEPVNPEPTRLPNQLTANELKLVAATDEFGFELFRQVSAATPTDENLFISPLSAAYALAMIYNGAAGGTRKAIATTLAFGDLNQQQVNESFAGLTSVLTGVDPSVITNIANAVWSSPDYTLVSRFEAICENYFDATVSTLDFTELSAADTINNWAARNTNDKIKKIVEPPLNPGIVCMMANAVYFKASWTFPFDSNDTHTDSFYTDGGDVVSADYMSFDAYDIYNNNGFDPDYTFLVKRNEFMAFTIPYGDRWFRMTVFLPDTSVAVDSFIANFTLEKWGLWRDEFVADDFMARFPKFKFSYNTGLKSILKAMGMEVAFQPGSADFSNMIQGDGNFWIDTVIQSTFVQVDEKGTEAAAITVVAIPVSVPPYVNCNRPFAFMIWERESGAVLFMGKIARPVWEE